MSKFRETFDGITPPDGLKERILSAAAQDSRADMPQNHGGELKERTPYAPQNPGGELRERTPYAPQNPPAPIKKRRKGFYRRVVALAVAASLVLMTGVTVALANVRRELGGEGMRAFQTIGQVKDYVYESDRKAAANKKPIFNIQWGFGLKASDSGTAPESAMNTSPSEPSPDGGAFDGSADGSGSAQETSPEHSAVNNQVEGVAESDAVLTDGRYIYALSYYGLTIAALDSFTAKLRLEFDNFFPSEMFLLEKEGLLVVLGNKYDPAYGGGGSAGKYWVEAADGFGGSARNAYYYWNGNTECARVYGVDALLGLETDGDGKPTDGAAAGATMTREVVFPRAYRSVARMIGSNLYLVYNGNTRFVYDESGKQDVWIPEFADSANGGRPAALPPADIYASPDNGIDYNFTLIAALDVAGGGAAEVKAYFGSSSTVYASKQAFYVSFTRYSRRALALFDTGLESAGLRVLRFEIGGASLAYKGMGALRGYTLNQFGFDEYAYPDGRVFFRAATTDNGESFVTVFNADMNVVGTLSGLGKPGERIYSVRFEGTRAVVVTYRNIDPLYVIDLSDPADPKVFSELKISGVSDYLHFLKVNKDLVFALGRAANEWGGLGNVKVSLFDVSPKGAAEELAYYEPVKTFGAGMGDYSYSEATSNHKALLYYMPPDAGIEIFAFPLNAETYEYRPNGSYFYKSYSALMYYKADAAGGLTQTAVPYVPYFPADAGGADGRYDSYYYGDALRRAVIADGCLYLAGWMNIEKYRLGEAFIPDLSSCETLRIGVYR
ncbi:MAG: beta-propeller domain-containing protein [Clostridiales bacterium]|jgi:hypothetical protein|nr:beta-propeller domain-containing protein [Clostridiales bacterium]